MLCIVCSESYDRYVKPVLVETLKESCCLSGINLLAFVEARLRAGELVMDNYNDDNNNNTDDGSPVLLNLFVSPENISPQQTVQDWSPVFSAAPSETTSTVDTVTVLWLLKYICAHL